MFRFLSIHLSRKWQVALYWIGCCAEIIFHVNVTVSLFQVTYQFFTVYNTTVVIKNAKVFHLKFIAQADQLVIGHVFEVRRAGAVFAYLEYIAKQIHSETPRFIDLRYLSKLWK